MSPSSESFDVAIIGSGIAGSTLAAILARQGRKVVVFEAKSHPRFAIGESMILEASEVMRSIAEQYDVPELAYFSSENYFEHIGASHGVKRHFSYVHHAEDQPLNASHLLQAVIPKQPHGHELHLYRQDADYFLIMVALRYGAQVLQNTSIETVHIESEGVQLITHKGEHFQAEYVVDAAGFGSPLAKKFNLRHNHLQTHSRAIFTHLLEVPCYGDISPSKEIDKLPFQLSEGTLHHVFEGGWLWAIPFDNHAKSINPLCSVGLMLDPRKYPINLALSPREEFYQFIERFPTISAQFHQAKAVRDWTRTKRLQYSTKRVVGDRYCLLGQAAGFIDPLFSKGLYTALTCTSVLAHQLLTAQADYSARFFQPVEDVTLAFIQANDELVAGAYKSFADYRLWVPFSVLWLLGAYSELVKLTSSRALAKNREDYYERVRSLKLIGGSFSQFDALSQQIYASLNNLDSSCPDDILQVSQQMTQQLEHIDWMPHAFKAILRGKTYLPTNKLHPRLLRPEQGFMGTGIYRIHFFDNKSFQTLARFWIREKITYAHLTLKTKRAITAWQRGLSRSVKWGQIGIAITLASSVLFLFGVLKAGGAS